jgi:hypothetical protein
MSTVLFKKDEGVSIRNEKIESGRYSVARTTSCKIELWDSTENKFLWVARENVLKDNAGNFFYS